MERSGAGAPALHDHGDLRALYERGGPYVTVWANRPEPMTAPAPVGESLVRDAGLDTSEEVITAIAESVDAAFPDAVGVVVVADDSGVVLSERLPTALRHERLFHGALPAIAPVVEHRQAAVPFVTVVVDRRGADVLWSDGDRSGTTSVVGDDTVIRKVHAGGWSHRRFQQRAENTWEHTAQEVAETIGELASKISPRVITVAGDVRMTEMLRKRLGTGVGELVREVTGGRSEDGSEAHREAEVQRWIRTAIAEDTVAALQLFEQERGQGDRAADGADATFAALREARVDTLLVHDDADSDRTALFVPDEPNLVGVDRRVLQDLGYDAPTSARLVDVAIRSCILTSAGVRVVPNAAALTGGIGALLRW